MLDDLSIIIPVGPGETAWTKLLSDLSQWPALSEVLLVGVEPLPLEFNRVTARFARCKVRWLVGRPGRARQMNLGAMAACRRFLWFLHADSRLATNATASLDLALGINPEAIHYFDLTFHDDGPALARLNAWGANLRSRFLGLPFGDQGFCLSKEQFRRLGGFDETVRFGEDHLFIWRAHQNQVVVRPVGATVATSARKYARGGWLPTTLCHLWRTAAQALPQFARLLRQHKSTANKISPEAEDRLIVFTRCPDPGLCKTRLIPVLGEAGGVELHKTLVRHTLCSISNAGDQAVRVEIRYVGSDLQGLRRICGDDAGRMRFRPQHGIGLGDRLAESLTTAFHEGASKVAIIGTDCPKLDFTAVAAALKLLDDYDLVLGPAVDGGYYLIALRAPINELFDGVSWGEPTVLAETLDTAQGLGLTIALLPMLADVDREEDLSLILSNSLG